MEISQFFINGDINGAIAYMREHEEFKDILPAYTAIFEDCEYRSYDIPDALNDILRLYQIYFRDVFYCGLPEPEAAYKLLTGLRLLLNMPSFWPSGFKRRLKQMAIMRFLGKRRATTAHMSGGKRFRPSTASSCRTGRRNIRSTFSKVSYSGAGWII